MSRPSRIKGFAGGLLTAVAVAVAAPYAGSRFGEFMAIEAMQPTVIEQPTLKKRGGGMVLMKMVLGWQSEN